MTNVYILVSTYLDEELNKIVIAKIHGVFTSIESAEQELNTKQPNTMYDLKIIASNIIK